jgi:hypothetical protein
MHACMVYPYPLLSGEFLAARRTVHTSLWDGTSKSPMNSTRIAESDSGVILSPEVKLTCYSACASLVVAASR